ncbi:MAG: DUF5657 family protein [bacterium]
MNEIISIFESITVLAIVKLMIVILLLVYNVFAYLMMRQTRAMNKAVEIGDGFIIRILGISHFIFAVLVLLVAVIVL